jgi:hypothetical protein
MTSVPLNCSSENVRVLPIVIAELELGNMALPRAMKGIPISCIGMCQPATALERIAFGGFSLSVF